MSACIVELSEEFTVQGLVLKYLLNALMFISVRNFAPAVLPEVVCSVHASAGKCWPDLLSGLPLAQDADGTFEVDEAIKNPEANQTSLSRLHF